jgi:alpha-1,6-mannosyltransferase
VVTGAQISLHVSPHREIVSLFALGALGLAMIAFVAAGPWIVRTQGYAVFIPGMFASGVVTIPATMLAPAVPARAGLLLILSLASIMRLLVMLEEPLLSSDIYRYVWDGRVQAAGTNPYLYVPADATLVGLHDAAIYPNINRADYAVTAYPPVAEMFFLAVTRISETLTMMRLAMVVCEIAVIATIIDLLRTLRLPAATIVAWAWHPLAIWAIAHSGHVEALIVALLMAGVWLLVRKRALAGAIAVALAALTKPYALLALPSFWRRWDWRMPLAVAATIALCYLADLGAGRGVLGFLTAGYLAEEGFADGHGFWLVGLAQGTLGKAPGLTVAYLIVALGVMAWLGPRAASRTVRTPETTVEDIAILLMAGLFFLSPNYPWYFLAVVPFTALGGCTNIIAPAWALTLSSILLYRPVILPNHDLAWKTIANLPFVITAASALLHGRSLARVHGASQWTS